MMFLTGDHSRDLEALTQYLREAPATGPQATVALSDVLVAAIAILESFQRKQGELEARLQEIEDASGAMASGRRKLTEALRRPELTLLDGENKA